MRVVCVDNLEVLGPEAWDDLAGSEEPLTSYAWLRALETSGSVGGATGWTPAHLGVFDGETLLGAMPLYHKTHSFGEFVYDWAWAQIAEQVGVPYYPKLVSTSPMTPASGPRLMVRRELPAEQGAEVARLLLDGVRAATREMQATGIHLLFVDPPTSDAATEAGYFLRSAWQYHWKNYGYSCFEDFLGRLSSKRRREIRRERKLLREQGYRVVAVPGTELTPADLADLFRYYASTCRAYGNRAYLRPGFFRQIVAAKPECVLAFFAYDPAGKRIAGTFNVLGRDRIWGRYWGADEHVPYLHFETCLYAMIEWAISHGIQSIEPGAGGEHKYARGFEPVETVSAHWLASPTLHAVLRQVTERERTRVESVISELDEKTPIRRDDQPE
jgi:predicted N-acyltransferase